MKQADCTCRRCRWHQHQDRGSDTGRTTEPHYLALCGLRHHCGRTEKLPGRFIDDNGTEAGRDRRRLSGGERLD